MPLYQPYLFCDEERKVTFLAAHTTHEEAMDDLGDYLGNEGAFDYISDVMDELFENKKELERFLMDLNLTLPYPDTIKNSTALYLHYLEEIKTSEKVHDWIREDRADFGINVIHTKGITGYVVSIYHKGDVYYKGIYLSKEEAELACRKLLLDVSEVMYEIYNGSLQHLKTNFRDYDERSKWITNQKEFEKEFSKDVMKDNTVIDAYNKLDWGHNFSIDPVKILS